MVGVSRATDVVRLARRSGKAKTGKWGILVELRRGADCFQRPLVSRSRFQQQLTPSVGRQRREGKNSKDDLFMEEEMFA